MTLTSSKLGWPRRRTPQTSASAVSGLGWVAPEAPVSRETSVEPRDDIASIEPLVDETSPAEESTGEPASLASAVERGDVSRETTVVVSAAEPTPVTTPVVDEQGAADTATQQHSSAPPTAPTAPVPYGVPSNDSGANAESETPSSGQSPDHDPAHSPVGRALERPQDPRVFTVSNQKGGVGKTTTTVNLAAALAMGGLRVLVIDLDPQGNASTGLGIAHPPGTPSTYDVIVDKVPLADVIQEVAADGVPTEHLYCIPATSDLAGAEVELAAVMVGREFRLREAIRSILDADSPEHRFDYVFIDCPPSLGLLTVNALAAAAEVLIPVQCEYYALEGLGQLLETVELIKGYLNPNLHVSTMLLTMFDARTKLAGQVVDEVREHFGDKVMSVVIPRSVKVSEAPSYAMSVMSYDASSRGAVAYAAAARELTDRQ